MMKWVRCDPGAVLLLGILFFSMRAEEAIALLAAAAVHEAGHVIALLMVGSAPEGIRFQFSGPVIIYQQPHSKWKTVIASLSGPTFGVLLFFLLQSIWPICAEVSLLLSAVNLLPVFPLDGGRALQAMLSEKKSIVMMVLGILIPIAFLAIGLLLFSRGQNGSAVLMFGAWLLLLSCQERQFDVK